MITKKLQTKLHSEIPLTQLMNITIINYNEKKLTMKAPLQININDKGTAFGGSLSTLCIINAWSLCWLFTQELGYEKSSIVVYTNETKFLNALKKELFCEACFEDESQLQTLTQKLQKKKSGSIKVRAKIFDEEKTYVEYNGVYVIKLPSD